MFGPGAKEAAFVEYLTVVIVLTASSPLWESSNDHHCHQTQAKEAAFVEYLKACEGGKVPAKAPVARVRPLDRDKMAMIKIQWEKAEAFQSLFIATQSFGFLLIRQTTIMIKIEMRIVKIKTGLSMLIWCCRWGRCSWRRRWSPWRAAGRAAPTPMPENRWNSKCAIFCYEKWVCEPQ